MTSAAAVVRALQDHGQDFEWYPTTEEMIRVIAADLKSNSASSILDIGAGDGRVLMKLAEVSSEHASLYAIEKSHTLRQAQPEVIVPVGVEFWEQDLMSLAVDVVFSNPPYSEFEAWATRIIDTAHAGRIFLVLPQRWKQSAGIAASLKQREAVARTIYHGDFLEADRRSRAVVDVVKVSFDHDYGHHRQDPFDIWFDQNIDTFDREEPASEYEQEQRDLARLHTLDGIASLVAAYDEDHRRMEDNYKAIFRLDYALLKELGVDKAAVRDGLKKRMAGLRSTYWHALFDHLDAITSRLTTKTRRRFTERVTCQASVAFTASNAYAVVMWAIKFANQYFDQQLVELFRELSTHDGVTNYKSNQRTWQKDGWRYMAEQHSHYALDYRIVLHHFHAIDRGERSYDSPAGLHKSCHEVIADIIAVFGNLGFLTRDTGSLVRLWLANDWQDFRLADGRTLFQVKAFMNGNLHFRFMPAAIKALNIEAGRLLGWIRSADEAVSECDCTPDEARQFFGANQQLVPGAVKLLGTGVPA